MENVNFIPAPRTVNLAQTRVAAGLAATATADEVEWYPEARIVDDDSGTGC